LEDVLPVPCRATPSLHIYSDHFHCFGCGAHGDAIAFVRKLHGMDFAEAVHMLAAEAGIAGPGRDKEKEQRERDRIKAQRERLRIEREKRERQRRIEWPRRLALTFSPASGKGAAEEIIRLYFERHRAIPTNAPYPDSIRFDADNSAIVGIASDRTGQITGGQRIYLTKAGNKMSKAEAVAAGHKAPKETFGIVSGSAVEFPARRRALGYWGNPVRFITESVEAAASVWQVTGQPTCATLGVGNLHGGFRHGHANVVCLDDDPRGSAAWQQANKAIRAARRAGHLVLVVNTWQTRRGDKTDLNDLLRGGDLDGPAKLEARIEATLFPEKPKRRKRINRDEAIRQIRAAAERASSTASQWEKRIYRT
jgi:hypothetical protein